MGPRLGWGRGPSSGGGWVQGHSRERGTALPVVAIDGPAGSGKSTVARGVAAATGLPILETGAMYRAVTWAALRARLDPADGEAVTGVTTEEVRAIGSRFAPFQNLSAHYLLTGLRVGATA